MKQFCETASIFELDNVKNEASLRGFLIFRSWQRQKRSNYARRPSKIESWLECRANGLVPMRFAMFPLHLSKVLRLPRESDVRSYKVLHLSRKIMLPKLKIQCSKMQPLSGNQTPDLPTSLPREIYFCRSSSNVPRLPSKCSKTFTFCSLLTRCTIPCACHAKRHLNVQKWSEHVVLCTFWLRNMLRATTACTFSTSQLPKVVQERGVFCAFWLRNVLRATTACTFSTSQLPKVFRTRQFFSASRHNGDFFNISASKSFRTRQFF